MTDSIFDFKSRTYASTIVPRELALGACSRGSVCAWGDDYIILTSSSAAQRRRKTTVQVLSSDVNMKFGVGPTFDFMTFELPLSLPALASRVRLEAAPLKP